MEKVQKNNGVYLSLNYQNTPIFTNKVALVTGGSSGIGYATAKLLLASGADVIITGRDIRKLTEAKENLGEKCHIGQFDISDIKEMEIQIDKLYDRFSRIDYLVANAGVGSNISNFNEVDEQEWERIVSVHMKGNYFIIRKIYNKMCSLNMTGNIVAVSSNGSFCGHLIPYGMAKAGLNNFIQGLAKISIENGIRCNAVAPGYTATNIFASRGLYDNLTADGDLYKGDIRGKRFHRPEEIAQVICFLLSDSSSCINGQVIACDSGDSVR